MAKEQDNLESLLSKFILIQSKLEYEANALENLIIAAKNQAEKDNSDLVYLLDALENRAITIKNTVFEIAES